MNVSEDRQEAKARAADVALQERVVDDPPPAVPRVSPGYVRARHPGHGEQVVFVPGELLPDWVVELMTTGSPQLDPLTGAWIFEPAAKARRSK